MDSKFSMQEKKCLRNHVKSTTFSTFCTRSSCDINTDNSLELIKACLNLNLNHHIAAPHRAETNGIAERAFSAESKNGRQHSRRSLDYMKVGGEKAMACRCYVRKCKDLIGRCEDSLRKTVRYLTRRPDNTVWNIIFSKKTKADCISVDPEYSQAYALGVPCSEIC